MNQINQPDAAQLWCPLFSQKWRTSNEHVWRERDFRGVEKNISKDARQAAAENRG